MQADTANSSRATPPRSASSAPPTFRLGLGAVSFVIAVLAGGWLWLTGGILPDAAGADPATTAATTRGGHVIHSLVEAAERREAKARLDQPAGTPLMLTADMSDVDLQRLSPELSDAAAQHLARGQALLAVGRNQLALPHLERAAALAPDSPDARYHLGMARILTGDIAAARTDIQRLRKQNDSLASLLESLIP